MKTRRDATNESNYEGREFLPLPGIGMTDCASPSPNDEGDALKGDFECEDSSYDTLL